MKPEPRQLWSLVTLVAVAVAVLFVWASGYFGEEFARLGGEDLLTSNIAFFLLINLNIILVMVLAFLVIRNIVKLLLDRRREMLGAKLRTRLVVAFVGLSLVPTVLLFFVSRRIVNSSLELWFSPQVTAAVDGALAVSRYHYDSIVGDLYRQVRFVALRLSELAPYLLAEEQTEREREVIESLLREKLAEYGLVELRLVDKSGRTVVRVAVGEQAETPEVNLESVREAFLGEIRVRPESTLKAEVLRGYAPVRASPLGGLVSGEVMQSLFPAAPVRYSVVASAAITGELSQLLGRILDTYDDFNEQKSFRTPLASSYLLTLVIVTLLIMFCAIWVGFYLARTLTVPIQHLAEGTQEIARGNWNFRIPEVGVDELSILVRSFNQMSTDLQQTTGELVARRHYMETVLASLGVGVLSFDVQRQVTTVNEAAAEILGLQRGAAIVGSSLGEVLRGEVHGKFEELLGELAESRMTTTTVSLFEGGAAKHIQVTATRLLDTAGGELGTVLLLDDLTELVNAQRMAAWQEVARRMAHEIKNPLTPIQLSVQRLQRRFDRHEGLSESDRGLIAECADAVSREVEILRTLVNEFSRFARLPKARLEPTDINQVIRDTAVVYRGTHPTVEIVLALEEPLPEVEADREQLSRVFTNLLDNAVTSIFARAEGRDGGASGSGFVGRITIQSAADRNLRLLSIVVRDDGLGIPDADKPKLFEPYFSTRRGGTGLGLAIVSSIVSDHNGFIRVHDNQPSGAAFVIELPLAR